MAAVAAAIHAYVASGASALCLVQADDLAGEPERLNLPGTDRERPNWRRRIATPVDDLLKTPDARAIVAAAAEGRGRQ